MGFSSSGVWSIGLDWQGMSQEDLEPILQALDAQLEYSPEVEYHSLDYSYLFQPMTTTVSLFLYQGLQKELHILNGGLEHPQVLDFSPEEGRWFHQDDFGPGPTAVVINRKTQELLFQGEEALGKTFHSQDGSRSYRVIGVVDYFRKAGDFSYDRPILFLPLSLYDPQGLERFYQSESFSRILVRVSDQAGADIEEALFRQISALNLGINMTIEPLDEVRSRSRKTSRALPLLVGSVSVFMLINVALGLLGVIWYNTNRRRWEIGLRRALGATTPQIFQLILGESIMLSLLSMGFGLVLTLQFPLLGLISFVESRIYYSAMVLSGLSLTAIMIICSIYPAHRASSMEPAGALHEN